MLYIRINIYKINNEFEYGIFFLKISVYVYIKVVKIILILF